MACNYFYSQFALGVNSKQTCSVKFSSLLSKQDKSYIYYILSTVTSSSVLNEYERLAKCEFRTARHSSKRERVLKSTYIIRFICH